MSQDVWCEASDGAVVQIRVDGWPEGVAPEEAPQVFGSFWPPHGVRAFVAKAKKPDRVFSVDLHSSGSLLEWESEGGEYFAEHLDGFIAVHAAVMASEDQVLVLPGPTGVGKSTLCLAAQDAGWQVWSDEYCLIDTSTGEVSGWPRPIRQPVANGGMRRVDRGGFSGPGVATHVVALKYADNEDAPALTLEPMSPGQVAMFLMSHTVGARSRAGETFLVTTELARHSKGLAGSRGEATKAMASLGQML